MELEELIRGLSDLSAYPEPVDSVEVRQTHISVVFLTGRHAYKIKKPVDLGFVDYTSLERRRHFCDEEVRLNRRLAPAIYLGVVPVTRDGPGIRMEGEGDVVEWAVKMEQLAESATLGASVKRGEVGAGAIQELAGRLATFHAGAEGGAKVALGGSFDSIARNARENFEQTAEHVGVTVSRATHARLRTLTESALAELRDIITNRAARGISRDTHGDLRLDHVYWFPEKGSPDDWVVVDCIEFSERFRHADPIAEVAFLAMELAVEGRGDLAEEFVEAYLRVARDDEGRALLRFYRAYRALVRAKVHGMKLARPEVPSDEKDRARAKAQARWLFGLAELEAPGGKPCVVLVGGLPGSGKSTVARTIGEAAGFSVIRSDVVRKELDGYESGVVSRSAREGFYTEEWKDRTYRECLRRAGEILFEGGRVLVDATFQQESRRRMFLDAARRWGVGGWLILCRADPHVIRERLERRTGDVSDADWAVHCEMARRWEELTPETAAVARWIDSGGTEEETVRNAQNALREFGVLES